MKTEARPRINLGHYNGPITVDPDTELFDIAKAAEVLGFHIEFKLVDPVRAAVEECMARYKSGALRVRWP